jgi:hypothetical protein
VAAWHPGGRVVKIPTAEGELEVVSVGGRTAVVIKASGMSLSLELNRQQLLALAQACRGAAALLHA